ncbi:MAG: conjugal transfer protein TraX [Ruminococcus sp.]|nr:conjugal transfer protein TraX [Ruminococcus sp.]MCM1380824.1 conjugal transfer protein TraX [Muribaculaceae bacterium]
MQTSLVPAEKGGLSANALKYIAAAAMLVDHIAWCFVETYSVLGQIMHVVGRLTAPIMCYFIAEGYYYTRNVKKYLLRLGIFAVISWFPFVYMEYGTPPIYFDSGGKLTVIPIQGGYFHVLSRLVGVSCHTQREGEPVRKGFAVGTDIFVIVYRGLAFFGNCLDNNFRQKPRRQEKAAAVLRGIGGNNERVAPADNARERGVVSIRRTACGCSAVFLQWRAGRRRKF